MLERPVSVRGDAVAVAAPLVTNVVVEQELATGAPDWRWIERVAALIPEPVSDSVQVTVTDVEFWLVAPSGAVMAIVGAVLSTRTVPEVVVAPLPTLSPSVTCQR